LVYSVEARERRLNSFGYFFGQVVEEVEALVGEETVQVGLVLDEEAHEVGPVVDECHLEELI